MSASDFLLDGHLTDDTASHLTIIVPVENDVYTPSFRFTMFSLASNTACSTIDKALASPTKHLKKPDFRGV
jgi:hypothetical protein